MTSDLTFWLDAHLKPDLADWIGSTFKLIAKPLREIGLADAEDPVIFNAARQFGRIVVVTKDEDFVQLVERRGPPPQIVWLTVGNVTTPELRLILSGTMRPAIEQLNAGAPVIEISR